MDNYRTWSNRNLTDMIMRYRKEILLQQDRRMKEQLNMILREMIFELDRRVVFGDVMVR